MIGALKKAVDRNIPAFIKTIDKEYSLKKISPLLYRSIKNFLIRDGKRIRPILFVIGYLGFAKRKVPGLYRSALAIELLHDFMLVHDDIIDKSLTRRGKPSMHAMLDNYLKHFGKLKFSGQDMALVAGDVMYAMAIDAFLSIKEEPCRKEKALKNFIRAAIFTGGGEFIELVNDTKKIHQVSRKDIYKIYDYKTAHYTFATPLSTGAILAGASPKTIENISRYGIFLGRAFQIKDDILGVFGDEKKIGKSTLSDLQESKKTVLIWKAYQQGSVREKSLIKRVLTKKRVTKKDLRAIRLVMEKTGALRFAQEEIDRLTHNAQDLVKTLPMRKKYRQILKNYPDQLLRL